MVCSAFVLTVGSASSHLFSCFVIISCTGSGLFTRRFVGSKKFKGVIAADFSESMLQQTKELFNKDQLLDRRSAPASITGVLVHANAFLHMECLLEQSPWHHVWAFQVRLLVPSIR